jgi:hypothetical protein
MTGTDTDLLALFEEWKIALGDEAAATSEHDGNRAHERMRKTEQTIRRTPAEGLTGIAVKLALWRFINTHSGADDDQAEAAYRDVTRMISRDLAAEAEAFVKRRAA